MAIPKSRIICTKEVFVQYCLIDLLYKYLERREKSYFLLDIKDTKTDLITCFYKL